jgi:hypothetical protein
MLPCAGPSVCLEGTNETAEPERRRRKPIRVPARITVWNFLTCLIVETRLETSNFAPWSPGRRRPSALGLILFTSIAGLVIRGLGGLRG